VRARVYGFPPAYFDKVTWHPEHCLQCKDYYDKRLVQ
jgi:hypothetical protein